MKDIADKQIKEELDEISKKIDTIIEKIKHVDKIEEDESSAESE